MMRYLLTLFSLMLFAVAYAQSPAEARELELYDTWLADGKINIEEYNRMKAKLLRNDSTQLQAEVISPEQYLKRYKIKLGTGIGLTAASGGLVAVGVVVMNNVKNYNKTYAANNKGPENAIFATSGLVFAGGVALITTAILDHSKYKKLRDKVSLIGTDNSVGLAFKF